MRSASEQFDYITRTVDVTLPEGELLARLGEERPLRVKLGVDPTAPDVTLGWAVVFDLLRRFQEMGHIAVLILGDFTAQVGDPSERSNTRKRLSAEEVDGYVGNLFPVIEGLLLAENLEVRRNSEWLAPMDMNDVLSLTSLLTVARIMNRDDFSKRWESNEPISLIEFMYPLLQGMDSVAIEADVEIGGSDQLWNLLVGRDLQERHGQRPQTVATTPLLVGTDGEKKMSQSLGNYISVRDEPDEMFGKVMSIPDGLMAQWFLLGADTDPAEVEAIEAALEDGSMHAGETKRSLGRRIVGRHWGSEAADAAEAAFDRVFRDKSAPEEIEEFAVAPSPNQYLPALLADAGLVSSRSEARRLIAQGAVKIDGERCETEDVGTGELSGKVVQVGKRRFIRFVIGGGSN
jgi:tyrosyl-tRNA synthetase